MRISPLELSAAERAFVEFRDRVDALFIGELLAQTGREMAEIAERWRAEGGELRDAVSPKVERFYRQDMHRNMPGSGATKRLRKKRMAAYFEYQRYLDAPPF